MLRLRCNEEREAVLRPLHAPVQHRWRTDQGTPLEPAGAGADQGIRQEQVHVEGVPEQVLPELLAQPAEEPVPTADEEREHREDGDHSKPKRFQLEERKYDVEADSV